MYEWSLFTCWKEIYIYVEKCFQLLYHWFRLQSLSLTKLLEKCASNFMKTVDCKMNCKTIYMSFLLMSSCLLCSDNAFNLALFLNDNFFLKLIISKLRLHVETELNFKKEVILRCFFFIAKDDDLDSSFNLKIATNFIKFYWFIIFYNDWLFFFNLFLSVKYNVTRSKWADAENWTFESEVIVDLAVVDLAVVDLAVVDLAVVDLAVVDLAVVDLAVVNLAVLNNVDNESSLKFENLDCENDMKRSTLSVSLFFSSDIVN